MKKLRLYLKYGLGFPNAKGSHEEVTKTDIMQWAFSKHLMKSYAYI